MNRFLNLVLDNFLFSSSDFEIVDGVLILDVKSESSRLANSGTSGGPISYKVGIEHTPGAHTPEWASMARVRGGGIPIYLRSVFDRPLDWTFTCSCPSFVNFDYSSKMSRNVPPTICEHIGACLIVHFYSGYEDSDGDSEEEEEYGS